MTQDQALSILKTGANVFITGEPGAGKTYLISKYVEYLREHDIEPAITASTGIAATHIGGMTIHSWSGIGVREVLTQYDLDAIQQKEKLVSRIKKTHVLIIDEISMLHARTLDMVDQVCRLLRQNMLPFGGMQVVLVGDFFQLPPISKGGSNAHFAFESQAWKDASLLVCYLTEQHRQEDPIFLDMLLSIRNGNLSEDIHLYLKKRNLSPKQSDVLPRLFSHNADVDRINTDELAKIPGSAHIFDMQTKGSRPLAESLKRGCLSPETLLLKEGARVMFTKNNFEEGFFNGTLGTVVEFSEDEGLPIVRTNNGDFIKVAPTEWAVEEGGKVLATISQLPLRLAWAITIHKSQGMSLDAALVDLSLAFEYGQGYVALSRLRTLQGLYLSGYNERALQVHPVILRRDAEFKQISHEAEKAFAGFSQGELERMHRDFVLACGGVLEAGEPKRSKKKIPTHEVTWDLLLKKLSPREIAKERGMTVNTIVDHIEKLIQKGLVNVETDCEHFKPSGTRFDKIKKAFKDMYKETGEFHLAPVKLTLGDTYDYDELRIARLFLEM